MGTEATTWKWQRKVSTGATPLVISAGWSPGAYDLVRALGMAGIGSAVASSQQDDIAFSSRYCTRKIVLPDFEPQNHEMILDILRRHGEEREHRPILFYASDPELWFVWHFQKELERYYCFLLPPTDLLECIVNKALFSELARDYHLAAPETLTVRNSTELTNHIDDVHFPCIVKPAYSQDWIWDTEEQRTKYGPYKSALRRFTTRTELLDFCKDLPDRHSGFLIQSYIDGRDEAITSFHGYFDEESKCLGHFVGKKIRTYPAHTGGSTYVRTIEEPELAHQSISALENIGFQGVVKIDFKWDHAMNKYSILEINPRYNLWVLLGAYAGVNLPMIAFHHQRGDPVDGRSSCTTDERLLFVKQDLRGFWGGYRKTAEWTTLNYIRSLFARKHYRVYDPDDPKPFIRSSIAFFRRNVSRLLGGEAERHVNGKLDDNIVGGERSNDGTPGMKVKFITKLWT